MDKSQKIKTLNSIQTILEDIAPTAPLQEIKQIHGDFIYGILINALVKSSDEILGITYEDCAALDTLAAKIKSIEESPVLKTLAALSVKLSEPATVKKDAAVETAAPKTNVSNLSEGEKAEIVSRRFSDRSRGNPLL